MKARRPERNTGTPCKVVGIYTVCQDMLLYNRTNCQRIIKDLLLSNIGTP